MSQIKLNFILTIEKPCFLPTRFSIDRNAQAVETSIESRVTEIE